MKFNIRTELGDDHELKSSGEIEWAVDRLLNDPSAFLCIEPETAINGINFIEARYVQKTKGILKKKVISSYYEIELQEEKTNGDLYHYYYNTEDFHDAFHIISSFYESHQIPDITQWECELFYRAEE